MFENISFGLMQGQRTAIVAKNGAGKSTLLRIIFGNDIPDSGEVIFRKDIRVAYLEQQPAFNPDSSIIEHLFESKDPNVQAIRDYELALEHQAIKPGEASEKQLAEALKNVETLKAWDTETKIREVLGRLNIHQLEKKMGTLSGGQRKRVALAALLIKQPDLVLLDEPTNHLDFDMIEWLESYFKQGSMTLLMVTHDRYFLDNVCNDILELDRKTIARYKGNYAYYLEKKAAAEEVLKSEVEKAKNLYSRELEWMRRMPKARGTKAKSRIDGFYKIQEKATQKTKNEEIQLSIKSNRLGGKILELIKISKKFEGREIINPFTYTFRKGEKIGIVGKNGSGKSTFLKLIMGEFPPDSGKIQIGETVIFGYYSQDGMNFPDEKRVIEVVKDIAEFIPMADGTKLSASGLLKLFLFPPEVQYTPVSKLSGGEKRRLYLLTILMKNPNFLILDEPTNDLDIVTLNVLEDFLGKFQGCLMVVTHDRYFMDNLTDHLFVFEGNAQITDFNGNYTDYRNQQAEKRISHTGFMPRETSMKEAPKKEKTKPSFRDVHEYGQLEHEIPLIEEQIKSLTSELNSGISDHMKLTGISEKIARLTGELDEKTNRWLELSEKIG